MIGFNKQVYNDAYNKAHWSDRDVNLSHIYYIKVMCDRAQG